MQRCLLLESCLYTQHCTPLHCSFTLRLPTTLELQPIPEEMQNTALDHIISPKSAHAVDTHLNGQTQEELLLVCSFQYGDFAIFYSCHSKRDHGRENCSLCFGTPFFISEENRVPAAQSDLQDRQEPHMPSTL